MCHRWWRRGERAPGTRQIGYQWAYIFSAVRPDTGDDVTLVMPSVNAKVMDLFLAHFADTLDQDAHAVMMCDGAGWHDERALTVPDNVTLALLPPYSPELNPVERVWLYLRGAVVVEEIEGGIGLLLAQGGLVGMALGEAGDGVVEFAGGLDLPGGAQVCDEISSGIGLLLAQGGLVGMALGEAGDGVVELTPAALVEPVAVTSSLLEDV